MLTKTTEHDEQVALINWCNLFESKYPELALIFAIPNGGKRHVGVARKLKAEGVKAGVPDLMLPVARGCYHGLFVEMKTETGKLSVKQSEWRQKLSDQGYRVVVCYGVGQAIDTLESYLES